MPHPGARRPTPIHEAVIDPQAREAILECAQGLDSLLRKGCAPATRDELERRCGEVWGALHHWAKMSRAPDTRVSEVLAELADIAALCRRGRSQRRIFSWTTLDALLGRFPVPNIIFGIEVDGAFEPFGYGRNEAEIPRLYFGDAGAEIRRAIVLGVTARVRQLPDLGPVGERLLGIENGDNDVMPDLRGLARGLPPDMRAALADHCERVRELVRAAFTVVEEDNGRRVFRPLGPRGVEREWRAPSVWWLGIELMRALVPEPLPLPQGIRLTDYEKRVAAMLGRLEEVEIAEVPLRGLQLPAAPSWRREIVELLAHRRAIAHIEATLTDSALLPDPDNLAFLTAWYDEICARALTGAAFGRKPGSARHIGIALPDLKLIHVDGFSSDPVVSLKMLHRSSYKKTMLAMKLVPDPVAAAAAACRPKDEKNAE